MKGAVFESSDLCHVASEPDSPINAKKKKEIRHPKKNKAPSASKEVNDNSEPSISGLASKPKKPKKHIRTSIENIETSQEVSKVSRSNKPKKRNKSVSLVSDDIEIDPKKSKTVTEESTSSNEKNTEKDSKRKKNKKNKKSQESEDVNEEPSAKKQRKKKKNTTESVQSEDIEEDLENLTIGDNPSTLADLLDDVQVADKPKKQKKNKTQKRSADTDNNAESAKDSENADDNEKPKKKHKKTEKNKQKKKEPEQSSEEEQAKEKVKWHKRKWNKERRGPVDLADLETSVIVDNLPFSLLLTYKNVLSEHFAKCGLIKRVGVAEFYPTAEPRHIFATTMQFYSEGAAKQALEEDNMEVGGNNIRVFPLEAPTVTTVVVRCYAGCAPHLLASVFATCGRVRNIREIQKGKSSISTAFVEFVSSSGVEKALKVNGEARIGGKKVMVSRYEDRSGGKRKRQDSGADGADVGSEDSD